MRYTVTWKESALDELAMLWMSATDRAAVSNASNEIDRLLLNNPHTRGESREEQDRILSVSPLTIDFRVLPDDLLVQVLSVRLHQPPTQPPKLPSP